MRVLTMGAPIPFEISHLVCDCKEPKWEHGNGGDYGSTCRKCKKIIRVYAHVCDICEDWFINDFDHPFKCNLVKMCWDCLETNIQMPLCDTIESKLGHIYCNSRYLEPRPPLPKFLTKRERGFTLTPVKKLSRESPF